MKNGNIWDTNQMKIIQHLQAPCHKTPLFNPEKDVSFIYEYNNKIYRGTGRPYKEHTHSLLITLQDDIEATLGNRILVSKRYVEQNEKWCFPNERGRKTPMQNYLIMKEEPDAWMWGISPYGTNGKLYERY